LYFQLYVADLNVITGLELLGLTCIYDLAIHKSSVSAVQVRNHDPAIAAKRHRAVNSRYAGVVEPDSISSRTAYIGRGAPLGQINSVFPAIFSQQRKALNASSGVARPSLRGAGLSCQGLLAGGVGCVRARGSFLVEVRVDDGRRSKQIRHHLDFDGPFCLIPAVVNEFVGSCFEVWG